MARDGITNAQAKFLGQLCRELGVEYPGHGMRRGQAAEAIKTLVPIRDAQREALRDRMLASVEKNKTTA